jgi:hypothetical protein
MVVKIIKVEKHKQRAVDVAKDRNYVHDMVDVLLKAPLDDGRKPLNDRKIASLLLVSLVIDFPHCEQSWVKVFEDFSLCLWNLFSRVI